jgi:hypothetical protein
MALNEHFGNPAALVFECPKCSAGPGFMCVGAKEPAVYRYSIHKDREELLEMPKTRDEWDRRIALVRAAFGLS